MKYGLLTKHKFKMIRCFQVLFHVFSWTERWDARYVASLASRSSGLSTCLNFFLTSSEEFKAKWEEGKSKVENDTKNDKKSRIISIYLSVLQNNYYMLHT